MARPNVLFIFTDQQRADTIHAAGNPVIKTPHLDRLVREGTRFSSAYTASPVCVPARCSLITGRYAHNTGCPDNGFPMPDEPPSFMQLLTDAGYRTHGIGKMHFTPEWRAMRGFQTRAFQAGIPRRPEVDDYLRFLHENGYGHVHDAHGVRGEMYYVPQPAQMPARLHVTQWCGDLACEFIRAQPSGEPFFLWASFQQPHPPFAPPTPWNKLYRWPLMPLPKRVHQQERLWTYANRHQNRYKFRDFGIDYNLVRGMKAYYYATISFIDHQVGRMLDALAATGRLDDTLIVFTSDHGEFLGDYDCFGKRSMLDAAARIPLIVRLPGRFAAGESCDTPVSTVDVMPTILGAAGVEAESRDGTDLVDVVRQGGDRTVYSQYQRGAHGVYMALDRRWKYYYSAPDRREFLFDRLEDPEETRSRPGLGFCGSPLDEMRGRLIARFGRDGYEEPLDGDGWRLFPQPVMPEDPDAMLLVQDAKWSTPLQDIPGYSD
jgi:arylsulfatase